MKISESLFQKYNVPVPRYTSYPPATSFHNDFSAKDFIEQVKNSNQAKPENISIYVHIPFCPQRCHFCGCNTAIYQSEEKIRRYVDCLKKEIRYMAQYVDKKRLITQVSWGGGTPNSIHFDYIQEVMYLLRAEFTFADYAEIAMECSPAYLEFSDVDRLADMGFNRVSLGIQDFHTEVLHAINRKAPKYEVSEMLNYMRRKGFRGLNIDLVYGLPLQTIDSFQENIRHAIELQPDRIATFSYAHIPWFNAAQQQMDKYKFPTPEEKLQMLLFSINELTKHDYEVIGMDHFARKDDDLAVAKHSHLLHRNFQGYNTRKTAGQVYAFGASGISQLDGCFAQNIKTADKYIEAVEAHGIAVERGYALTREDKLIRDTINEIMCNGNIDFSRIAKAYGYSVADFLSITRFDKNKLGTLLEDGLIELTGYTLRVTEPGMMVVRNVAVAFDPNYVPASNRHSTTI